MNGSRRKPIVWTWPIVPGYMVPKGPVENEAVEEMEAGSGAGATVQEQQPSPEAAMAPEEEKEFEPAQVSSAYEGAPEAAVEERVPPTAPGYPNISAPALDNQTGYQSDSEYQFELEKLRLARAYIPWQKYGPTYSPREALERGTLFPDLYSPYPY